MTLPTCTSQPQWLKRRMHLGSPPPFLAGKVSLRSSLCYTLAPQRRNFTSCPTLESGPESFLLFNDTTRMCWHGHWLPQLGCLLLLVRKAQAFGASVLGNPTVARGGGGTSLWGLVKTKELAKSVMTHLRQVSHGWWCREARSSPWTMSQCSTNVLQYKIVACCHPKHCTISAQFFPMPFIWVCVCVTLSF